MNIIPTDIIAQFLFYPRAALYLGAGVLIGIVFFRALWWQTRLITEQAALSKIVGVMALRLALLTGPFVLASMDGMGMLLSLAGGVMLGRHLTLRRIAKAGA